MSDGQQCQRAFRGTLSSLKFFYPVGQSNCRAVPGQSSVTHVCRGLQKDHRATTRCTTGGLLSNLGSATGILQLLLPDTITLSKPCKSRFVSLACPGLGLCCLVVRHFTTQNSQHRTLKSMVDSTTDLHIFHGCQTCICQLSATMPSAKHVSANCYTRKGSYRENAPKNQSGQLDRAVAQSQRITPASVRADRQPAKHVSVNCLQKCKLPNMYLPNLRSHRGFSVLSRPPHSDLLRITCPFCTFCRGL